MKVARVVAVAGLLATTLAFARGARGAETEPCVHILNMLMVPAIIESTVWIGGAVGSRGGDAPGRIPVQARAGAGLSFALPSSDDSNSTRLFRNEPRVDLRPGIWVDGETDFNRRLAEGGLEILLSTRGRHEWGTYTLRAGGAYGRDDLGTLRQLSFTLTGGLRAVPGRYAAGGVCDQSWADSKIHAYAHGVRLFVTTRFAPHADDGRGVAIVGGIEIDPLLLLPPYERRKWIGGMPND